MFAGLMRLKLEGFRQQWNAQPLRGRLQFIRIPHPYGPGERTWSKPQPAGLEVRVHLQPANAPDANQREAVVRIGVFGNHGQAQESVLPSMAPRIFQSLPLPTGSTEHRLQGRWLFTQRVGVYPVLAHLEIGSALGGSLRDVSLGGVRVQAPQEPPTELPTCISTKQRRRLLAVLGRIIRVLPEQRRL